MRVSSTDGRIKACFYARQGLEGEGGRAHGRLSRAGERAMDGKRQGDGAGFSGKGYIGRRQRVGIRE